MGKERRTDKTKRGARRGFMRRATKAGVSSGLTVEEYTLGVRAAYAEVEGKMSRAEVDKALGDLLGKAKANRFRRATPGVGGGYPSPGRPLATPAISDSVAKSIGYRNGADFGKALESGKEGSQKAVSRVWSAVAKSKTGRYGLVGAGLAALIGLGRWALSGEDEVEPAPSEAEVAIDAWQGGGADIEQLRIMMGPQMQEAGARAGEARENLFGAMVEDEAAQRQFSMSEIPLAMAMKADRMRMEAAEEPRRKQEMMEALMIADRL